MLTYTEPTLELEKLIEEYRDAFIKNDETIHGAAGLEQATNIKEWINFVNNTKSKETVPNGFVTAHTFLLLKNTKVIGIVNARHELNDYLRNFGGHIGYSILKNERRKGYGKLLLNYACNFLFSLGLEKILITCDNENVASKKTIEACGGILENEILEGESTTLRFWIYRR